MSFYIQTYNTVDSKKKINKEAIDCTNINVSGTLTLLDGAEFVGGDVALTPPLISISNLETTANDTNNSDADVFEIDMDVVAWCNGHYLFDE